CAGVAIGFGIGLTVWVLGRPAGSERMREISQAVQEGAAAYLRRQYTTIGLVSIAPFLLLGFYHKLGWGTAVGFLIGAGLSAAAGFIGMNVAVRANVRTAEAARHGLKPALNVAFRAGSVTGLFVVGLGLFGVAGYYGVLTSWFNKSQDAAIRDLIGLAFGGSLISVFARLGGGIYTKAADVGADLVGKIEAGIPEDDPRNPAVIADNVGDNVGDCAGMAADVFETYAVSLIGAILVGALTLAAEPAAIIYPFVLGGISVLGAICGVFFVNIAGGKPAPVLMGAVITNALISAILFWPATHYLFPAGITISGMVRSPTQLYFASVIGLVMTAVVVAITNYYTSMRYRPVQKIAHA